VLPVPPLTVPDRRHLPPPDELASIPAVALYLERAQAVDPAFGITSDNAQAIAEICVRLDGLPLAIELAAARGDVYAPAEVLARLRQRFDVLARGAADLPLRQRFDVLARGTADLPFASNHSRQLLTGATVCSAPPTGRYFGR
jgi:predicted ATPase